MHADPKAAATKYQAARAAGAELEFLVKRKGQADAWLKETQINNKHLVRLTASPGIFESPMQLEAALRLLAVPVA